MVNTIISDIDAHAMFKRQIVSTPFGINITYCIFIINNLAYYEEGHVFVFKMLCVKMSCLLNKELFLVVLVKMV